MDKKWPRRNRYTNLNPMESYQLKFIRAKAMLEMGKTYDEIRAATGLARKSISRVAKGEREVPRELVDLVKRNESAKFTVLVHQILDSISEDNLDKASLLQKTTAACQLIDKRRLIDGQSTQNIAHAELLESVSRCREALVDQLERLGK